MFLFTDMENWTIDFYYEKVYGSFANDGCGEVLDADGILLLLITVSAKEDKTHIYCEKKN